jgi:hypothetical protein
MSPITSHPYHRFPRGNRSPTHVQVHLHPSPLSSVLIMSRPETHGRPNPPPSPRHANSNNNFIDSVSRYDTQLSTPGCTVGSLTTGTMDQPSLRRLWGKIRADLLEAWIGGCERERIMWWDAVSRGSWLVVTCKLQMWLEWVCSVKYDGHGLGGNTGNQGKWGVS